MKLAFAALALIFATAAHAQPCYITERDNGVKVYLHLPNYDTWDWRPTRKGAAKFSVRQARHYVGELSGPGGRDPRRECARPRP